jgi:NADH-quinone oxidoreductase subunit H
MNNTNNNRPDKNDLPFPLNYLPDWVVNYIYDFWNSDFWKSVDNCFNGSGCLLDYFPDWVFEYISDFQQSVETWFRSFGWGDDTDKLIAISIFLFYLILVLCGFLVIAYSTLAERKTMASMQRRKGPNVVGPAGAAQPLADGAKLLTKETIKPKHSDRWIFFTASGLGLALSLYLWLFLPLNSFPIVTFPLLLVYILAIQIIETYSLILAGWASNSKYALLGSLRTAAQMVSYELALSFVLLAIVLLTGSFDLLEIVRFQQNGLWFIFSLFPLGIIFFCSMFAESNRTPFDLPEAEAELVAGYNVEYSAMFFAVFFLAEYSNMILLSALFSLLFLGGWTLFFLPASIFFQTIIVGVKTCFMFFVFVWVRATLPRYRYDQLMDLGWKVFLPFSFGFFIFLVVCVYFAGALPQHTDNFIDLVYYQGYVTTGN